MPVSCIWHRWLLTCFRCYDTIHMAGSPTHVNIRVSNTKYQHASSFDPPTCYATSYSTDCKPSHLIYCLHHFWSAALCPEPADIVNGMVTFIGNSVGDTAMYNCNSGFELIGSVPVTCIQVNVNSAAFSPSAPVCRREYCMIMTS